MKSREIEICGLSEIDNVLKRTKSRFAITILGSGCETPKSVEACDHLRLSFMDTVDVEHPDAPTRADIIELLADGGFLLKKARAAKMPLVINCHGGVCRSTAAALILLSANNGPISAMRQVLSIREEADPNILMCKIADEILGTNALEEAVLSAQPEIMRRFAKRMDLE